MDYQSPRLSVLSLSRMLWRALRWTCFFASPLGHQPGFRKLRKYFNFHASRGGRIYKLKSSLFFIIQELANAWEWAAPDNLSLEVLVCTNWAALSSWWIMPPIWNLIIWFWAFGRKRKVVFKNEILLCNTVLKKKKHHKTHRSHRSQMFTELTCALAKLCFDQLARPRQRNRNDLLRRVHTC